MLSSFPTDWSEQSVSCNGIVYLPDNATCKASELIYVDEIDQEIPNLCLLYIASSSRAGSVQYGYIQSLKRELQSFAHNIRFSVCYQNQNIDQLLQFLGIEPI